MKKTHLKTARVNIPLAMVHKLEQLDGNENKTLTAIVNELIANEIDNNPTHAEAHKVNNESTKINKEQNR
ncbi:TPA: hypothetical protein NJ265_003559 [Vibrio parahaemolyticus]|uniref:hypothetical protein n=1 Tax=Vibrio TaxID=662 RepID=UPI001121215C|nr:MULTISPECIES: hypothetical protein [Vibrio]EGU0167959.1 hypothetical protein [Vibrio parahaemolyticus]EHH1170587.1 hypothetical protein [Vibrio parahaemolyticus]EHR0228492.1 hypothetical protein [Vibrio parahaemolyticus]EIO3704327.1 hypothetical protein [Vibrio parahaemolyticus]EIV8506755.1 hypothetical protein [Vibrio parahaemolyticus]